MADFVFENIWWLLGITIKHILLLFLFWKHLVATRRSPSKNELLFLC
jgi:hypothetical protein